MLPLITTWPYQLITMRGYARSKQCWNMARSAATPTGNAAAKIAGQPRPTRSDLGVPARSRKKQEQTMDPGTAAAVKLIRDSTEVDEAAKTAIIANLMAGATTPPPADDSVLLDVDDSAAPAPPAPKKQEPDQRCREHEHRRVRPPSRGARHRHRQRHGQDHKQPHQQPRHSRSGVRHG